jgi:predicted lysophospholipase L1 biosynthesis ABC-type transport system permease subunit
MPTAMARIWDRRYWLAPVALAVLLVVFLVQELWIDSVIVCVFLAGVLGSLAVLRRYERSVFEKIKQGQPEDWE